MATVMDERRRLINLAYRMLGSLAEAEDAVQETYARWYAMPDDERDAIASPGAWLTKVASRVCLDVLGSARARRERYVGEWIPEPVPDATQAACRQLASSARRRVHASRGLPAPSAQQDSLVREFKRAWDAQDIGALVGLLDPGVTLTADGGGLATAARRPIEGAAKVARFMAGLVRTAPDGMVFAERTVNGQPGVVALLDGVTVTVFAFGVTGHRIGTIWAIRNPGKLRPWTTFPE